MWPFNREPKDYVQVRCRIGYEYNWHTRKCEVKKMPNGRLYILAISDRITLLDSWGLDENIDWVEALTWTEAEAKKYIVKGK